MSLKSEYEKFVVGLACLLGVAGVAWGMIRENHGIFLGGICLVVVGYLFIRGKLKG